MKSLLFTAILSLRKRSEQILIKFAILLQVRLTHAQTFFRGVYFTRVFLSSRATTRKALGTRLLQSSLIEIFLNAILGTSFAVAKQSIRQSSICYCELLGYDNAPMSNDVNSLLQRHNLTSQLPTQNRDTLQYTRSYYRKGSAAFMPKALGIDYTNKRNLFKF